MQLTFSSEVGGDARPRPPPVRPGALILPGRREERNRRESLRSDRETERQRGTETEEGRHREGERDRDRGRETQREGERETEEADS